MLNSKNFKITNSDYIFIAVVVFLVMAGLAAIYSASHHVEAHEIKNNVTYQMIWFSIAAFFMVGVVVIPTKAFYYSAYWIYSFSLILVCLTLVIKGQGHVSRWISIAGLQFQPSELMKIGVILSLARYLSGERLDLNRPKNIGFALLFVFVPFIIICQQPDLGTALVFAAIILPILYWAGLPAFYLFAAIAPFIVMIASFNYYTFFGAMVFIALMFLYFRRGLTVSLLNILLNIIIGIITPILWNQLYDYQKHRILTFLGIEIDPYGLSYQIIQSKVAIGSGGFWGKGMLNGTQTQLRFLPAQHTDFVFSVIGEEFGFLGSLLIMGMLLFILLRGIYIASIVKNPFLGVLVIGAVTILAFHVIINIGMTVGMMPVTGLPLPFLSYGGSFLIACMIFVGIIIHASIRRFKY